MSDKKPNYFWKLYLGLIVLVFGGVYIAGLISDALQPERTRSYHATSAPQTPPPLPRFKLVTQIEPIDKVPLHCNLAIEMLLARAASYHRTVQANPSFSKQQYLALQASRIAAHPSWTDEQKALLLEGIEALQQSTDAQTLIQHRQEYLDRLRVLASPLAFFSYASLKTGLTSRPDQIPQTCADIHQLLYQLRETVFLPADDKEVYVQLERWGPGEALEYVNNYFKHYFNNKAQPVPLDGFELDIMKAHVEHQLRKQDLNAANQAYHRLVMFAAGESHLYPKQALALAQEYALFVLAFEVDASALLVSLTQSIQQDQAQETPSVREKRRLESKIAMIKKIQNAAQRKTM